MKCKDMCWGDPLPPEKFVEKYSLPQVVRVTEDYRVEGDPHKISLNKPLLLYKAYQSRKVHARVLVRAANGQATEVGSSLIIPDSYEGWLAIITKDGRTAGYFRAIHELVTAQVPYFLTKNEISGFRLSRKSSSIRYKIKVPSGEVLQLLGTHRGSSSLLGNAVNYAKVLDRQGNMVLLPYSSVGKFYAVAGRRTRGVSHVYQIAQLLRLTEFPLDVRLVSGAVPTMNQPFTGLLRVERVIQSNVILACARSKKSANKTTLFEMDMSSSFRFLRPLDRPDILASKKCTKMLRFTRQREMFWRNEIKVEHQVLTAPSVQDKFADDDEERDSAVRCSVNSYPSSSSSKLSSSHSLLERLRTLRETWRKQRSLRSEGGRRKNHLTSATSDFHMYEKVNRLANSWSYSSLSTEILEDDGYVTSDFDEISSNAS